MGQWVPVLDGVQVVARLRMWLKVYPEFGQVGPEK
jgi:hypothetical protein